LGSTGSIGRSALDVVRHYPELFEVVGLGARANADLLAKQIDEFSPRYVAVADSEAGLRLSERLADRSGDMTLWIGADACERLAEVSCDATLCAIVGAAGLTPVLKAIDAGNRVALANKEPMVMAGELIMKRARDRGVEILPVDSEHNAIFQCLQGHRVEDVQCVHLTASGGPFYGRSRESLKNVTPEEAVRHPTWDMGAKISVDSATLMNKGLEVIEAMRLFDLPLSKIEVVIHPQSVIHSLVEFTDGGILGHLGVTDMRFPILFALTWPERVQSPMARLSLTSMRELTFRAPDFSEFPCLGLAMCAARAGGTAPAVLNGANEVSVSAFCNRQIGFLDIEEVVRRTLESADIRQDASLESVIEADGEARRTAREIIRRKRESEAPPHYNER
jgi:1-deoxy-D-xylulose-5-phosphate reductoisomerase